MTKIENTDQNGARLTIPQPSAMMDLFLPIIKADFLMLERYSQVMPETWLEAQREGKKENNPFVLPIPINFCGGTFVSQSLLLCCYLK